MPGEEEQLSDEEVERAPALWIPVSGGFGEATAWVHPPLCAGSGYLACLLLPHPITVYSTLWISIRDGHRELF